MGQVPVHISWFKKNTKYYVKARESGQLKFFLTMKLVETKTNWQNLCERKLYDIWNVWYNELRTLKSSKLLYIWSSQLWRQSKQLHIEAWQSQDFNGVWTRDLAIPCDALTNWTMKPLILKAGHLWVQMSPWRMDLEWYMKCFHIELRILKYIFVKKSISMKKWEVVF